VIAQIQEPKPAKDPPALVRARRLVAATLLAGRRRQSVEGVAPVPAWKAWLWAALAAAAIAACAYWLRAW